MSDYDYACKAIKRLEAEAFDCDKVMKEHNITWDDVKVLREMLSSCELVPRLVFNKVLFVALVTCENDKDKSFNLFQNYCQLKRETPEFFAKRDVLSDEIQQALSHQYYVILPPTPSNYNLIFHKLSDFEPKNYIFDAAEKTFLMTIETCIFQQGPRNGVIFLWDMEGGRIGHVFQPKFSSIRKLIRLVDDGCPFNIQEIHVLNTQPFLNMVLALFKPFMKSDLLSRVHFHPKNMDYEKFYQKCIPKHCLPSDYGGDLASVDELHGKHRKNLLQMREYFLLEERVMNFEFEEMKLNDE